MLDLEVWLDRREDGTQRIRHRFYEKPMASPLVFGAMSAYTWRTKIVTLGEELKRRMMNTDGAHSEEEIVEIGRRFLKKMTDSGYGTATREEVIKSGLRSYYRRLGEAQKEGRGVYRSSQQMKESRRYKSLQKKTWFKSRRGGVRCQPP